jgi:hypothetical protein
MMNTSIEEKQLGVKIYESMSSSNGSERKESRDSKDSLEMVNEEYYREFKLCDVQDFRIGYCTLYLDFDSHSDKYISDLVSYWLTF